MRQCILLDSIIGCPFGSIFEVVKNANNKKRHLKLVDSDSLNFSQIIDDEKEDKDNRFILDVSTSQLLSRDDIETLKDELSSKELIENIVENCTTFKEKTSYAQEKYLRKKKQKYAALVTILKPNVRLLVHMYYSQNPMKTRYTFDNFKKRPFS